MGDKMVIMEMREAEDFNYRGGHWPGYMDCPVAIESPSPDDIDPAYDYHYAAHFALDDWHRSYRPDDDVGMHGYPLDDPGAIGTEPTVIAWITEGDWWRYTFNVEQPGWMRVVLRLASPREAASVDCFWDEKLIVSVEFSTGSYHEYRDFGLEPFVSPPGHHILRVMVTEGQGDTVLNFDKVGILFSTSPPGPRITRISEADTVITMTWEEFGDGTYYVEGTEDLTTGDWKEVGGPLMEPIANIPSPDNMGIQYFWRIRSAIVPFPPRTGPGSE